MKQTILLLLAALFTLTVVASDEHEPSPGAQGIAGAKGTIEFKPEDWRPGEETWWEDSDGVDPGVAGCHIGTDSNGEPNGRMFGEGCLDENTLVESNPAQDKLHSHKNDIGHPDTIDCNAWCVAQGAAKGFCEVAPAPPCEASARCVCD